MRLSTRPALALVVVVGAAATALILWLRTRGADDIVRTPEIAPAQHRKTEARAAIPNVHFRDITREAGIKFRHVNGAFGKKLLPETMGAGVAVLDFDRDGLPDLLFINSCYWPGHEKDGALAPTLQMYRNRGNGKFEDVTKELGLSVTLYGMGVCVGDIDNDGWPDLFVTGVGGNILFRNTPAESAKRRFVDVTREAGVAGPGRWPEPKDFLDLQSPVNFSTSATFLDYDNDGLLDLFVCNYVSWSPDFDFKQDFKLVGVGRAYGPPRAFEGSQCLLYRNRGAGRFDDVSARAGIQVRDQLGRAVGKSMGVVVCDVDEDGWPDLLVANDTVRNFFFHNKRDGTFEEIGEQSGVAYPDGNARGAMGIDYGECRPGRFAVLIGNFANEPNSFLRLENSKRLWFSDVALAEGIAGPSRTLLKFGVFFFDYDLDGRQDLLTCNGHLEPEITQVQQSQSYKQPVQLFWHAGKAYEAISEQHAGPDLFVPLVGRGCAFADIDGDGNLDIVLTENGGPARLLRNEGGTRHHWIRLALEGDGKRTNRSAIGARVTVEANGVAQRQQVVSARGYLSQSETVLTFGLGTSDKVDRVIIHWPGRPNEPPQVLTGLKVDRVHLIQQAGAK